MMMLTFLLVVLIAFVLFLAVQTNLIWYWHKKNDGADGKWPWFVRWEHKSLLSKLNPKQQKEFMLRMHFKLRDYNL